MTASSAPTNEFFDLMQLLVEDQISEQQAGRLEELLWAEPANQARYIDYMLLVAGLHRTRGAHGVDSYAAADALDDDRADGGRALRSSPGVQPPVIVLPSVNLGAGSYVSGWLTAYLVATVIFGVGALVGALTHVSHSSPLAKDTAPAAPNRVMPVADSSVVGRITGMADCKWRGDAVRSSTVVLKDRYDLASGCLEITYDTGATVLLQGPATYEVESQNGGYLSLGKLTAKLEKRGEGRGTGDGEAIRGQRFSSPSPLSPLPYPLFAVRTPTAIVTDLGTEFGIEVDRDGATTSHVFRGSVRVQMVANDRKPEGEGRILRENESVRIDGGEGPRSISVVTEPEPARFLRRMPKVEIKTLDLVDVVAGGDGFSGRRGRGIDPVTGRVVHSLDTESTSPRSGDGRYHPVADMPFIDGVFIPDGGKAEVQVDSAGHSFDLFQGTDSRTWQHIWAGGPLYADVPTTLGATDYASSGHGLLYLCSSTAITFDLNAIRQAYPQSALRCFRSAVANVGFAWRGQRAGVWVLVDGKSRFRNELASNQDDVHQVTVALNQKDRYLTLAVTDGGDGSISHDWIIFGDPRLECLSSEVEKPTATENESRSDKD